MKKYILSLILMSIGYVSNAQYTAGFESWHSVMSTLTIPNGWNATDSLLKFYGLLTNPGATFQAQVVKEMPGNASTSALKVVTKTHPGLPSILPAGVAPCMASNSAINVNTGTGEFSFVGGTPYTYSPTYATMWVKNNVIGGDSTSISFEIIDNSDGGDSIVAWADTLLGANITGYTQITMPFKYNPTPGFNPILLRVIIASSGNFSFDTTGAFAGLNDGTWLVVDDINLVSPAGVTNILGTKPVAEIYPTLIKNDFHVDLLQAGIASEMVIYDIKGAKVYTSKLQQNQNVFNLSSLSSGLYVYHLLRNNEIVQQGKIQKQD